MTNAPYYTVTLPSGDLDWAYARVGERIPAGALTFARLRQVQEYVHAFNLARRARAEKREPVNAELL